jgi:hypothetical protein
MDNGRGAGADLARSVVTMNRLLPSRAYDAVLRLQYRLPRSSGPRSRGRAPPQQRLIHDHVGFLGAPGPKFYMIMVPAVRPAARRDPVQVSNWREVISSPAGRVGLSGREQPTAGVPLLTPGVAVNMYQDPSMIFWPSRRRLSPFRQ